MEYISGCLAVTYFGIDPILSLYAVIAFVVIGVMLTSMILFTKAKFVTSEECTIKINDDEDLTKIVRGGGTLLSALTSAGIPIPSPCGGKATCKQCKVKIIEGADAPLETDKGTFSKKQLKEGIRLSCQSKVHGDMHLEIDPASLDVKKIRAKVISNENVATFIKELIVEVPEEDHVSYKSGEYLQFWVPPFKTNTTDWKQTMDEKYLDDWNTFNMFDRSIDFGSLPTGDESVIRAYSMASYPGEKNTIIFNIRIATPPFKAGKLDDSIPWGICSTYTFSLKPGDEVTLSGPYGESYMIDDDREIVFLIGGAGSSFGRSHIMDLFRTNNTKRKVTMWYGARSMKENIYEDDYHQLEKDFDNFKYHLVLSEPIPQDIEDGWDKDDPVKTNYLFRAFELGQLKEMEAPEDCLYYVCGPPMHNISVMKLLDDYGVPRDNIILDDFGS
jgi:Na+-transporting NADH:ubiquinone oxidoreductase subunit F